jgi:multidrug transporter EmrE-like cation transporter
MKLALILLGYACSMAGANICLNYAALAQSRAGWWTWFIAANAVGFLCVVSLPHALKLAPPNIVYALAIGGGYLLLQIAAFLLFREPLSAWQWAGIALIGVGTLFLQLK